MHSSICLLRATISIIALPQHAQKNNICVCVCAFIEGEDECVGGGGMQLYTQQWQVGPDHLLIMDLKSHKDTECLYDEITYPKYPEKGDRFYFECSRPLQRLN